MNKEAAVFMPMQGPFKYQYIATCATDECPFIGKFLFIYGNCHAVLLGNANDETFVKLLCISSTICQMHSLGTILGVVSDKGLKTHC
jgi:hypothetical protein